MRKKLQHLFGLNLGADAYDAGEEDASENRGCKVSKYPLARRKAYMNGYIAGQQIRKARKRK